MFSVTPTKPLDHTRGEVTWHFSLTSIRGVSRLLIDFICLFHGNQYRKRVVCVLLPKVNDWKYTPLALFCEAPEHGTGRLTQT